MFDRDLVPGSASLDRLHDLIDWTQPIELDDGTPLRVVGGLVGFHVDIRLAGASYTHSAFPIDRNKGSAQCSTGLVISNHKFHVRNRIMKKIDTTKPLEIYHGEDTTGPVTFVTETSDGGILVSRADGVSRWMIFAKDGTFLRSENNTGVALRLRNKAVKTCEYHAVHRCGAVVIMTYRNRALAWDQNPEADHLIQIDKTDGVVTGVGVLKRPL